MDICWSLLRIIDSKRNSSIAGRHFRHGLLVLTIIRIKNSLHGLFVTVLFFRNTSKVDLENLQRKVAREAQAAGEMRREIFRQVGLPEQQSYAD
jgi:hypothetical protein